MVTKEKRQWITPILTKGVQRYAQEPMLWIFESVPKKIYYRITVAEAGSGKYDYALERVEFPPESAELVLNTYVQFSFESGENVETVESGRTGSARRKVIELRKVVAKRIEADILEAATRSTEEPDEGSVSEFQGPQEGGSEGPQEGVGPSQIGDRGMPPETHINYV